MSDMIADMQQEVEAEKLKTIIEERKVEDL